MVEGNTWVTDLTHFLDEDGFPSKNAAKELSDTLGFFGTIAQAASARPNNLPFCSTVLCRRAVGRKSCGANLAIGKQADGVIHWQCPKCGEQGFLRNWQGTRYDLSGLAKTDPAEELSLLITQRQHALLKEIITNSQEVDAVIAGAEIIPQGIRIAGSPDNFDELLDSVAFEANHTTVAKRCREMQEIFDTIEQALLLSSDDQDLIDGLEATPVSFADDYESAPARLLQSAPSAVAFPTNLLAELQQALEERIFISEEARGAFVHNYLEQHVRTPLDDFSGLSAEQMYRLLYFPFDSPSLVSFSSCFNTVPSTPILILFNLLTKAIGDQGLKATTTGNLPRKCVQEAALAFMKGEKHERYLQIGAIRSEMDFFMLHVTRLVAARNGLIRKYKGKFILSRELRELMTDTGLADVYLRLFKTFVRELNWGYMDAYPDIPFLQHAFLFTLYLLDRYGDEWRPMSFYEDAFLRAFPDLQEAIKPVSYASRETLLRGCYSLRCLERFAAFLGLIEMERKAVDPLDMSFTVRKTPLFGEVIKFHLAEQNRMTL